MSWPRLICPSIAVSIEHLYYSPDAAMIPAGHPSGLIAPDGNTPRLAHRYPGSKRIDRTKPTATIRT